MHVWAGAVVWACGSIIWGEAAYDQATTMVVLLSKQTLKWDRGVPTGERDERDA